MKKVLILGGGIAGIEAAIYLRKKGFKVTVVSNRDYLYIYPISIWVPTNEKEFKDVCLPLNKLAQKHGFDLLVDEVSAVKAQENTVHLKNKGIYKDFDYLVLAMGAGKLKPKGWENTLSICGAPEEAIKIKARIDELMEKGTGKIAIGFGGNPKDQSAVRGGPAFEVMFNIDHALRRAGLREKFDLTFFAPMESPGARMGKKAVQDMGKMMQRLGIETRFGKKISEFAPDGILLEDDTKIISDFTMFISAGAGHTAFQASDLPLNEAGFVKINDYCQVDGYEKVFAIGDTAALVGPDWKAKQGHVAEVMARNTAHNIDAMEKGQKDFLGYQQHLSILCVMDSGNAAAYVQRDNTKETMLLLPVLGHWLKKGWGVYYKLSKMNRIPRLPGM